MPFRRWDWLLTKWTMIFRPTIHRTFSLGSFPCLAWHNSSAQFTELTFHSEITMEGWGGGNLLTRFRIFSFISISEKDKTQIVGFRGSFQGKTSTIWWEEFKLKRHCDWIHYQSLVPPWVEDSGMHINVPNRGIRTFFWKGAIVSTTPFREFHFNSILTNR